MAEPRAPRRLLAGTLALGLCLALVPERLDAQSLTPGDVLARLASIGALRARFRESKHIAILRTPLVSSGELFFTRPGWIARRIDKPEAATMLLRDGQLTIVEASGKRVFDTSSSPVLRAFVDSFVQVLSGDRAALERSYTLALEALPENAWRLKLTPTVAPLSRHLSSLLFEGAGNTIARMVMTETNGDVSTTEFSAVQHLTAFPPAERDRLFTAPR